MNIVIIEDEILAAEKLERYLKKWNSNANVVAHLTSIEDAVNWLKEHPHAYDVAFFDIQLRDGLSFDIFKHTKIEKPIIFITAFDEYALDAFKVNSISYILKPITFLEVSEAMSKLSDMKHILSDTTKVSKIGEEYIKQSHKERFLVKMGSHIHSVKTEDIALFFADGRTVFLVTNQNKKYILDYKLEELMDVLHAKQFFRVNRTYIINLNAIKDVLMYSNSRLKVATHVSVDKDIIISREKVSLFKKWFEGIY